jgi:hypothetical protein
MRFRNIASIAAVAAFTALLPLGCSSDDDDDGCEDEVVSRLDPDADFASYETYAVADDFPKEVPDDVRVNLEAAIDASKEQLDYFGLVEVEPTEDPDLVLFTLSRSSEETGVYWECYEDWYWYGYWTWVWDPCAWMVPVKVDYTVGTLVVGLADPAAEKVVYGGVGRGVLECGDVEDRIPHIVNDMFEKYPR